MSNENDKVIKVTEYGEKKDSGKNGAKIDIYSSDPKDGPHDSIHIEVNTDNKTYKAATKINGEKELSSGSCYLTTACMKHMKEKFDDNCYELTILRWFRDNFVSKEDINLYYEVAPAVVENIDKLENNETIYQYIYTTIIDVCVKAIEQGDYEFAYKRYKSSVLALSEQFNTKEKETPFVKKLGSVHNKRSYAF